MRFLIVLMFLNIGAVGQDPANWCRAGFFTSETDNFSIATVKAPKGRRTYFYNDYEESCPASEKCRAKTYLVPGDQLVVSKTLGDFACGWYTPTRGYSTVGWIRLSDLQVSKPIVAKGTKPWLGEWRYADNSITFTENKLADYLNVVGDAIWKGVGDNVHIGELDGRYEPSNGIIKYADGEDEYDCKATLRLLGEFLVVSDNLHCGGANVSFSGVYRRTKRY